MIESISGSTNDHSRSMAQHEILGEQRHEIPVEEGNEIPEEERHEIPGEERHEIPGEERHEIPGEERHEIPVQKDVTEMTNSELELYRHSPETELSALVCHVCERGDYKILEDYLWVLKDTEPDKINEVDRAGMTALHFAVSCQNEHVVNLLIRFGANIDKQDALGFTPLFLATGRYPKYAVAKLLLENGKANVHIRTHTGATALHGASLQGNTDCVELLLDWGADPRCDDEDGTTPFELSKDIKTRTILHDFTIKSDAKRETVDAVCANCKQIPKCGLQRCSQCHVTMYCGRECQVNHWRLDHRYHCIGYVIARPSTLDTGCEMVQTSFYRVMGSTKPNIKVFMRQATEALSKMQFLRHRRFVVKVQLPIGKMNDEHTEMMAYNVDRTVEGFVYKTEQAYEEMAQKIRTEGFMGVKAFFWSEITEDNDGTFKIFHGKCAPYQQW